MTMEFWAALLQITFIDMVLSGDNAMAITTALSPLSKILMMMIWPRPIQNALVKSMSIKNSPFYIVAGRHPPPEA